MSGFGHMVSGKFHLIKSFQGEKLTYFWSDKTSVMYFAWEKHGPVDHSLSWLVITLCNLFVNINT